MSLIRKAPFSVFPILNSTMNSLTCQCDGAGNSQGPLEGGGGLHSSTNLSHLDGLWLLGGGKGSLAGLQGGGGVGVQRDVCPEPELIDGELGLSVLGQKLVVVQL